MEKVFGAFWIENLAGNFLQAQFTGISENGDRT
jgi:hypothetical protein